MSTSRLRRPADAAVDVVGLHVVGLDVVLVAVITVVVDLTVVDGTVVEVAVGVVDVPAANVAKGVNKSRITFQNSITSYNLILN